VGWQKIKLDPRAKTVQLLEPKMQLDLGGIGKGYAGDCALRVLRQHGIGRALFEAGGDLVLGDRPPDGKGWTIKSLETLKSSSGKTWLLSNCAVSTSGDTEQFVEIGGKRYSHIVDPRTGLGLTNRRAVTIISPNGITSEGLSKALSILTKEQGHSLLRTYPHSEAFVREVGP
jgi:thiamine biosynthesis lipoprotein